MRFPTDDGVCCGIGSDFCVFEIECGFGRGDDRVRPHVRGRTEQHVRVHGRDERGGRNPLFRRGHEASRRVDGDRCHEREGGDFGIGTRGAVFSRDGARVRTRDVRRDGEDVRGKNKS